MPQYIILHKPYGVLSQFTPDHPGQRTLAEFDLPKGLYAAGRLDRDSEGLLLLTDDGELIHNLLLPGGHDRTYLVQVEGIPTAEALTTLELGVIIGDYRTLPCSAESAGEVSIRDRTPSIRKRENQPTSWIRLTVNEGKNRQVRRMTAVVGHPTLRLIRTSIGPIELGNLAPGSWRRLTDAELMSLKLQKSGRS